MSLVIFLIACGLLYPARTLIGLGQKANEWQLDIETNRGTVTVLTSARLDELERIAAAVNQSLKS